MIRKKREQRNGLRVERRAHPRQDTDLEIRVGVEIYGFQDGSRPFFASGSTANVGLGGMLARLDAPLSKGSVCKIFFRDEGDQVRPRHVRGCVVRCEPIDDGFLIGVAFDEELLHLAPEVRKSGLAAIA